MTSQDVYLDSSGKGTPVVPSSGNPLEHSGWIKLRVDTGLGRLAFFKVSKLGCQYKGGPFVVPGSNGEFYGAKFRGEGGYILKDHGGGLLKREGSYSFRGIKSAVSRSENNMAGFGQQGVVCFWRASKRDLYEGGP